MERLSKIIIYTLWIALLYLTNLWVIGLGISLFLLLLNIKFDSKLIKLVLPITLSLMLFVTSTYIFFSFFVILVYLYRCVLYDDTFNGSSVFLSYALLALGCLVVDPHLSVYPIMMTSVTAPVKKVVVKKVRREYLITALLLLIAAVSYAFILYKPGENKRAYLHHGVWANSTHEYCVDSLKSITAYSYSELVDVLDAVVISELSQETLNKYTELWVVTPTVPFSKAELMALKKWVASGGNLIVSSDHTDLYGHARCCNQIASVFNCKVNYSAAYDSHNKQFVRDSKGREFVFKTGTGFSGFAFPMWCSWLWEEDAYYMGKNFFGPLAPSGDDMYSDKVLLAQVPFAGGQVNFIQDSTIFANFCVYQPYMLELIELLSSRSYVCRMYLILLLMMILAFAAEYFGCRRALCVLAVYMPFVFVTESGSTLSIGDDVQYWSGNKEFVMENNCPYLTISTAFSLSPLSGKKPIWVEGVGKEFSDVIWVDTIPPPCPSWRWIRVVDFHPVFNRSGSVFDDLYEALNVQYIDHNLEHETFEKMNANARFNDAVMNDWWYDSGILKNREARIKQWLAWLNEDSAFYAPTVFSSDFSEELHDAVLRIDKKESRVIRLPKPLAREGEIYLGNGLAGKLIQRDNGISILGLKQYQENVSAPIFWAIDYFD